MSLHIDGLVKDKSETLIAMSCFMVTNHKKDIIVSRLLLCVSICHVLWPLRRLQTSANLERLCVGGGFCGVNMTVLSFNAGILIANIIN